MALRSLVVCADEATTKVLRGILEALGLAVEHCATIAQAQPVLAANRYDSVVLDCEDDAEALDTLRQLRSSSRSASALIIAIASTRNNVRQMFALGINFVLYKPISEERAWSSLRAARSLMQRERRRSGRVAVHAQVALDYANVENVPATLIDLSEEGSALQSEKKLPPDCRVYFQFALPGHTSLIRLSGEVVWQDSAGRVGMRFVNVPSSSRKVLRTWLATNAPATLGTSPQVPRPEGPIVKTGNNPPSETGIARLRSNPGNRRSQSRHNCRLGADVYRVGVSVPNRCSLSDISPGGCYIEMPTPLPVGTHLEIVVRTQNMKLRVLGLVQSVHQGFGMGVRFELKTPEEHGHVQTLIRLLEQSNEEGEAAPLNDLWTR
jgi:CheY-like chemotaxis protein